MTDQRIIISGAIMITLFAFFYLISPYLSFSKIESTTEIENVVLQYRNYHQATFLVKMNVMNPSSNPVTVEYVKLTLLVNGTDYNSREMQNTPLIINSGHETDVLRTMLAIGSPISTQLEGTKKRYVLETEAEVTISMKIMGMPLKKNFKLLDNMNWVYDLTG